jgi:uncharacterized protein with ATP-grasp and redox domains
MDLSPDCIPCFVRHALDMARIESSDAAIHERVLREVLLEAAGWDRSLPAPVLSRRVHRRLHAPTGIADPCRDAKQRFNELPLELLPELRAKVATAADPLRAAVRVTIAANGIDVDLVALRAAIYFETLAGGPGDIFFLLKIKCPVVAAHTGLEIGTHALMRYRGRRAHKTGDWS